MLTNNKYRLPAEWEPQSGIQLTWPHEQTDWAPMLDEVLATYREMAREIEKREPLLVVGPPTNDTWARDHGFITLTATPYSDGINPAKDGTTHAKDNTTAPTGEPLLLDFCFNGWGEKFPAELDNAINRRLFDEGKVKGRYVSHLDFVLEGGSIESDGRGTLFTTTGCLTAPHRNQPLTKDEIEARLKEYLGAERVLWIDHGQLTGDDTDGHIDTLVRICPDDTLLYIKSDNPTDPDHDALALMESDLKALRTADGRPYRLVPLPMPYPIVDDDGQRLPATYANFLIVNGAVLCPTYAQPDNDRQALHTIAQAFPGREVMGIDCRSLIRQHGSLHCCTMQFPEGVLQVP